MHAASVRRLVFALLASAALLAALPSAAYANIPRELRPGTRPWMFEFGLGPGILVVDAPTQFKLKQALHYHFSGRTEGPSLGFYLGESFGSNFFVFQVGPHFVFDIQPVRGLGFLLSPFIGLGYAVAAVSRGGFFGGRDDAFHFFNIQFGMAAKLLLGNRGFVYFQPFAFDMFAGDNFGMRYDVMFGGGVTF